MILHFSAPHWTYMRCKRCKLGIFALGRFDLRQYCYVNVMNSGPESDNNLKVAWGLFSDAVPAWQRTSLGVVYPVLKKSLIKMLNLSDAEASKGLVNSKAFFKEIDERLSDGRKYLLATDEVGPLGPVPLISIHFLSVLSSPPLWTSPLPHWGPSWPSQRTTADGSTSTMPLASGQSLARPTCRKRSGYSFELHIMDQPWASHC